MFQSSYKDHYIMQSDAAMLQSNVHAAMLQSLYKGHHIMRDPALPE